MKYLIYFFALIFSVCASHAEDLDTVWTHNLEQYNTNSNCVRFMPDGKSIIAGVGNSLYEFETTSGKLTRKFDPALKGDLKNIAVSIDGNIIIANTDIADLQYWDYKSGKCLGFLPYHEKVFKTASCFLFNPINEKLILVINDTILQFKISSHESELIGSLPFMEIKFGAISNDGKMLALAYHYYNENEQKFKTKFFLFDMINFKLKQELDEITRDVRAIAFSPSGKYVAFTTDQDDGTFLRIYNLENNTKILYNSGFLGYEPFGIVFLEGDSTILVSGANNIADSRTKLISINNGNSKYYINHGADQPNFDKNINNQLLFDEELILYLINTNWFTTSVPSDPRVKINGNMKIKYVNEVLSLDNTDSELIKLISVFVINGKLVKTYDTGYSGAKVDLPFSAPSGVYLVRIVTDQSDYNFKFVRE